MKAVYYIQIQGLMIESLYYQFQLTLHRLYLQLTFPCTVQIMWKRSKQKTVSKGVRVSEDVQYIDFNDKLKTKVKCKFEGGKPQPFLTSIAIVLYPLSSVNSSCKSGGFIENLDVTQIILAQNKKAAVSKRFQMKLQQSLPNSKLVFTLASFFVSEASNQQSQSDISFQANTQSFFNRSQNDMTFRPPVPNAPNEQRNRGNSRNRESIPYNRQEQQKLQSPLQRNQLLNQQVHRVEQTQKQVRTQQPLGFSFGPVGNPERQRQNRQNLEQINELRRENTQLRRQNERLSNQLRSKQSQRGNGVDDKKLQLINQLNAAINQVQQLRRQKDDIIMQLNKTRDDLVKYREDTKEKDMIYGKSKEQNREITLNFNKVRDQLMQVSQKLQYKKRQLQQLKPRFDKIQKQNEQMRNQIFRKQSELISNQNQLQEVKNQYMSKSIPMIQQLKRVNQDIGKQRAQLQKALNQKNSILEKEQILREQLSKKLQITKQEHEKQKNKLIEYIKQKQGQFQAHISQIEQQMTYFIKQKDNQIAVFDSKNKQLIKQNSELTKKLQQQSSNNTTLSNQEVESCRIQISELKVKIKHHEEIYSNLQKDYMQKQKQLATKSEFIERARSYVTKLDEQSREKDDAIRERDKFISQAKQFITTKEGQFMAETQKYKKQILALKQRCEAAEKLRNEVHQLSSQNSEKQKFLGDIIRQNNQKQQRIQTQQNELRQMQMILQQLESKVIDMQNYIDMQQDRFEMNLDEIEELNRKVRSQQQTLEDLVKKNLELQIDINLKNFQIRTLKGIK